MILANAGRRRRCGRPSRIGEARCSSRRFGDPACRAPPVITDVVTGHDHLGALGQGDRCRSRCQWSGSRTAGDIEGDVQFQSCYLQTDFRGKRFRAGNGTIGSAAATACSTWRCELTPPIFRNLRMLRLKVSSSTANSLCGLSVTLHANAPAQADWHRDHYKPGPHECPVTQRLDFLNLADAFERRHRSAPPHANCRALTLHFPATLRSPRRKQSFRQEPAWIMRLRAGNNLALRRSAPSGACDQTLRLAELALAECPHWMAWHSRLASDGADVHAPPPGS